MKNIGSYIAYPSVLVLGLALHFVLQQNLPNTVLAVYGPIIFAALLVMVLERWTPARSEWQPGFRDVKNDAFYMAIIQLALPKLLTVFFVFVLIDPLNHAGLVFDAVWPQEWPMVAQLSLMLVCAEFFRYWLHRAAHETKFLWRFHAVHHAPEKLYWFNVGRFHFVDKTLQFLFDALPFMLLGVSEPVLALYMVCYSINGFFQHSNIKLRFGWLNYLVSTAELHRWHHSVKPEESNCNYGNNLIIWDLLFGTWYLPEDRQVGQLGLKNRDYPQSFSKQFTAPFVGGLSEHNLPGLSLREILKNGVIALGMKKVKKLLYTPLIQTTKDPEQAQRAVLRSILSDNANCQFGREHHFSKLHCYEDYIDNVPIQTYETLQPYIAMHENARAGVIASKPIMYAQTSGTSGTPKRIPITPDTLAQLNANQGLFSYIQYEQVPTAFSGKLLGIMGAAVEGRTQSGLPYGAVSGMMYQSMPKLLKSKFVLPECVFDITDYELKYLLIARLAMAEKSITYMNSANPSTFVHLEKVIQQHQESLINDISTGGFSLSDKLPEAVLQRVASKLCAKPQRAIELQDSVHACRKLTFAQIWPHLQLLATWNSGSCGVALKKITCHLPEQTKVMDLGYISSEFRGTVPVGIDDPYGLPLLNDHFYEFVECEKWERGEIDQVDFLMINACVPGKGYYVFVTTRSGLYRYQMNDILHAGDRVNNTVRLIFCQKGKGITNITGEKLSETQVLAAIKCLENKGYNIQFFLMQADEQQATYVLYLEMSDVIGKKQDLETNIDAMLASQNIEYKSKRESGRLGMVVIQYLRPGTGHAYRKFLIEQGQRENQLKVMTLQYQKDEKFPLDNYVDEYSYRERRSCR